MREVVSLEVSSTFSKLVAYIISSRPISIIYFQESNNNTKVFHDVPRLLDAFIRIVREFKLAIKTIAPVALFDPDMKHL